MEKKINLTMKYGIEISDIENKLNLLQKKIDMGDVNREICTDNIKQLSAMLKELRQKIEYGEASDAEILTVCIEKAMSRH
jgi:hypothetical protein